MRSGQGLDESACLSHSLNGFGPHLPWRPTASDGNTAAAPRSLTVRCKGQVAAAAASSLGAPGRRAIENIYSAYQPRLEHDLPSG
jgi:hypothetical protein